MSLRDKTISSIKIFIKNIIRKNEFLFNFFKFLEIKLILKKKIIKQLSLKDNRSLKKLPNYIGKKVLVPIVQTNHPTYHHILIIAKSLELRGAEVKVLLCGEFLEGCEEKSFKNEDFQDPCFTCRLNAKNIIPFYKLSIIKLSEILDSQLVSSLRKKSDQLIFKKKQNFYRGININKIISDSVQRYYFGDIPKDQEKLDKVKKSHAFTTLASIEVASIIDKKWNPDIILSNSCSYSIWESYYQYFTQKGTKFSLINSTALDFKKIRFNIFEFYFSNQRFKKYLEKRKKENLTKLEDKILEKYLNKRFEGNTEMFKTWSYFSNDSLEKIKNELKIDQNMRNIFLFPNIYWDISALDMGRIYKDVIEWVIQTIELVKNENVQLYIKIHPGETYDSNTSLKTLKDYIEEEYETLPKNVIIITPEMKIKPYDLFPSIDLGIIYSGTLGLEMALSKIPVISVGHTPYSGLDIVGEPNTKNEYKQFIIGIKKTKQLDIKYVRLFAYFLFMRTNIPWNLTNKAFGERFKGFKFDSLNELLPGQNKTLDHLCNCIIDYENNSPEAWPD